MFDVLDELESAIDKVAASEREIDVERMVRLSERVEYLKLRTIRDDERSGAIAHAHTAKRAALIERLDLEFANLARLTTPPRLRDEVKRITDADADADDGDGGASDDARQQALNQVTLSPSLNGRGMLNGSLDAELSRLATCAFDAEMQALKRTADTRGMPERRAE